MNNFQTQERLCYKTVQALMNVKFFEEKKLKHTDNSIYEDEKINQWAEIYNELLQLNNESSHWRSNIENFESFNMEISNKLDIIIDKINNIEKTEIPLTDDDKILLHECMKKAEKHLVDIGLYSYKPVYTLVVV